MPELKVMELSKLKKAPYNPNVMPEQEFKKLLHNIKHEGYLEYIVVNKRTGYTIVSGNHRYDALKALGYKKAEVIIIDVPLNKEKALNLSFNRISGVLDQEKVSKMVIELEEEGFKELELTGLSEFEFDMIFTDNEEDPYAHEFDDSEIIFETENQKKQDKLIENENNTNKNKKKKTIICPKCNLEIDV